MEKRGKLHVSTTVPPPDPNLAQNLRPYQNCRSSVFCGFDDNKRNPVVFITTRFAESQQVHYVKRELGMREQLTFCDEPVKECYPATSEFRDALQRGLVQHVQKKRRASECAGSGLSSTGNGSGDGPLFVYSQDSGGDENTTYYLYHSKHTQLALVGGKPEDDAKSSARKVQNRSWTWNKTNGASAFVSNARDGTHFDLYIIGSDELVDFVLSDGPDVAKRGTPNASVAKIIHRSEEPGYLIIKDFVDKHLLVQHYVSVTESRLFVFTLDANMTCAIKTEEIEQGMATASVGGCGQLVLSCKDGALATSIMGILFSSDRGDDEEFRTLRYCNACSAGGNISDITTGKIPWNVTDIIYNNRSRDVLVGFNEEGSSAYYHAQMEMGLEDSKFPEVLQAMKKLPLEGLEQGAALGNTTILDAGDGTRQFGFSFVSPTRPVDVFVHDLEKAKLKVWTRSEIGGLNPTNFCAPKLIRYKSFDGLAIPAFVYCPPRRSSGDSFPVVIHPHGGPEGQHRPVFTPFYQFLLLELGVAIIDPNVRGSAGYGKTFVSLDNGYKREDSVKDIGALIDWIESEASVDPELALDTTRIAVWGGSYGGYMCLASPIHFNDRLTCGVDMVGISNFVTFLESTANYRRDLRRKKYGDERDPAMRRFLLGASPVMNADKIKAPLFVVQGKNDPRVPIGEAQQIYDTVRAKEGLEACVWYMVAEDEGHGFKKKANVDAYQDAMIQFFRKYLLSE